MTKRKSNIKKAIESPVEGLHLWKIKTNRTKDNGNRHLWITTTKRDSRVATVKAVRFERKTVGKSVNVYVTSLKYRGTIDA